MRGVVSLCAIELIRLVGNRTGSFPSLSKAEDSSGTAVTGIGGNKDLFGGILVVDYCEAFSTED